MPWQLWAALPAGLVTVVLLCLGTIAMWRGGGPMRVTALLFPVNVLIAAAGLSTIAANVPANRVMSLAMCTAPMAFLAMARGARVLARPRWLGPAALAILVAAYGYGLANYFAREQLLNPGYAPPWREVARVIEAREQPGRDVIWLLDEGFPRYYRGGLTIASPEAIRRALATHVTGRVWLIARDRGSAQMLDETEQAHQALLGLGWREEVFRVQPRTAAEQHWRTVALRRPAADAYVKVYLLSPPVNGAGQGGGSGDAHPAGRPD